MVIPIIFFTVVFIVADYTASCAVDAEVNALLESCKEIVKDLSVEAEGSSSDCEPYDSAKYQIEYNEMRFIFEQNFNELISEFKDYESFQIVNRNELNTISDANVQYAESILDGIFSNFENLLNNVLISHQATNDILLTEIVSGVESLVLLDHNINMSNLLTIIKSIPSVADSNNFFLDSVHRACVSHGFENGSVFNTSCHDLINLYLFDGITPESTVLRDSQLNILRSVLSDICPPYIFENQNDVLSGSLENPSSNSSVSNSSSR